MKTFISIYSEKKIDKEYRTFVLEKVLSCTNSQLAKTTVKKLAEKTKANGGYTTDYYLSIIKDKINNGTITDRELFTVYDDISEEDFTYNGKLYVKALKLPYSSILSDRDLDILAHTKCKLNLSDLLSFFDNPDSGCTVTDKTKIALIDYWSDYPDSYANLDINY